VICTCMETCGSEPIEQHLLGRLKERLRMAWERNYWVPQPVWRDKTVFILGGGASLLGFDASVLRGEDKGVMVLNSSYLLAPWADMLHFVDTLWSEKHLEVIKNWPTPYVVTTSLGAKRAQPDKIKRVQVHLEASFLHGSDRGLVRVGASSGHSGIGIAAACGAKTIVLLGYDMKFVGGRSHHHDEYFIDNEDLFAQAFLPAFEGWNKMAVKDGIKILNASPNSVLDEFPRVNLQAFLEDPVGCQTWQWYPIPAPQPKKVEKLEKPRVWR
jgi:hypothetical protein